MNVIWSRFLRSAYRREPITSFVVTVGAVDAAIGGLNEHWSLMTVGLGTVGAAIVLRWWQQQRQQPSELSRAPIYILPPHSPSPPLPLLSLSSKKPRSRKR